MTTFNVRSCNSIFVVPLLHVTDLQRMVDMGYLCKEDEIRKDGHRTWYPASTVVGLNFDNTDNGDKKLLKVDDWTFQIHKVSGKIEGPFGFKEIIALANLGNLSTEDALLPPACMAPIQLDSFRSITISTPLQKLFAKWISGKTDKPLPVQVVQKLIDDGDIPENCLVRGEDESKWTKWSNYTSPRELRMRSYNQHEAEVQQKQTATHAPFSYFPRKITAACITLGIIFALLFVFKGNTFSFISNGFHDVSDWIGLSNSSDVDSTPTQRTDETTLVDFTTVPRYENTLTHIPEFGPMWFNEKLALPVFGAFVKPAHLNHNLRNPQYPTTWMPQLLFIDAPTALIDPTTVLIDATTALKANSHIHKIHRKTTKKINDRFEELKAKGINALITRGFFFADKWGDKEWFEDVNDNSPEMSDTHKELFIIGQWMGLDNWIEYEHSNNQSTQWLVSPEDSLGDIIKPIGGTNGKIKRVEGDKNAIVFDRDGKGRTTVATWYDKKGSEIGPLLRWKYPDDYKIESFELFYKTYKNTNSMVWTPQYSKNHISWLVSGLVGEGTFEDHRGGRYGNIHFLIEVTYVYNEIGQITRAILNILSSTIDSEDAFTSEESEESEATFRIDYSYKEGSTYWDSATMAGERTHRTFNREGTPPIFDDTILGKIRYDREFIDNSK